MDVSGDDRESVRSSEDRPSEATGPAPSTESFPYLSIGLGILVVIGALVYVVVFSQGPSPVKRDVVSYQPTVQPPTTRPEEITPTPAPEPIRQLVPATTQEKPTAKQRVGPAKTITGKDGAPMVLIPDGEFWMGSPDGEGDKDEHPRHQVALVAFYMDKFEVTVSRYAEFMESTNRSSPEYWDQVDRHKHGALPIVGVDWQDAGAYCRWAGKRLPTEAEWEKAARGKDGRTYPWGNEPPTARLANFGKAFTANVYDERLAPVDSYAAGKSPYGLHHMAGNVWEWTADLYDEAYYRNSQERSPKGPSSGEYRVVRGGSWLSGPHLVRSATRYWNTPTSRLANIC
ncbi:MAG: formylglycine-generating enzyme family protein, partial [Nitrospira sp.]